MKAYLTLILLFCIWSKIMFTTGDSNKEEVAWMMCNHSSVAWIHLSYSEIDNHPKTRHAGIDKDGSNIYVGHTLFHGDLIPGKIIPSKNYSSVGKNNTEYPIQIENMRILFMVGYFDWVPSKLGKHIINSVMGGLTGNREPLYIARERWNGIVTPGKLHPSHYAVYIPFGGKEIQLTEDYEVLVCLLSIL